MHHPLAIWCLGLQKQSQATAANTSSHNHNKQQLLAEIFDAIELLFPDYSVDM